MKYPDFLSLLTESGRRYHLVGNEDFGVVCALDLEGRLFTVLAGEVLSRVNAEAIRSTSTRHKYQNPGGDVLWPAPEGTCLGYEYATGAWRVPPSVTGARYLVVGRGPNSARIEAEIDLINNQGLGIPCLFRREIKLEGVSSTLVVLESITYLGAKTLGRGEFLLAPWSLCQFDSGPEAEVVFPHVPQAVRDLYDPSESQRTVHGDHCHTKTDGAQRYQIALGAAVDYIEYRHPSRRLAVHRTAAPITEGKYVDIADAPPQMKPAADGVRFSVYSDPIGFMEIEAAGGCGETLMPGDRLAVEIRTRFRTL